MLHVEFRETPYFETNIEIVPANECLIPYLCDMLRNFVIVNPAKTFATEYKSGKYNNMSVDEIEDRAKIVNYLAEIWNIKEMGGKMDGSQPSLNVMIILSRLMQAYINLKLEQESDVDFSE